MRVIAKISLVILLLLAMVSCAGGRADGNQVIRIEGVKMSIGDSQSLFRLHYASDTLVVASTFSGSTFLSAIRPGEKPETHAFVKKGRGPGEAIYCSICVEGDSIYVLSGNPYGIVGYITIPLSGIKESNTWKRVSFEEELSFASGTGISMISSGRMSILGSPFRDPGIISILNMNAGEINVLPYWPDDGIESDASAKSMMYVRGEANVFCRGGKICYVCGEGRYAVILDDNGNILNELYSEYPQYRVKQHGKISSPERLPECKMGFRSFATEERIYLSPLEYKRIGKRIDPDNYKGYPHDYTDIVEIYDWEGNLLKKIQVDVPFCGYYVSEDDSALYTITVNLDTQFSEIYKYNL